MNAPSAVLCPKFVPPGEGVRQYAPGGDINVLKLCCADSGNAFQCVEIEVVPGGGPPLHVHDREDELFYVVEGEVQFWTSDPGDVTGKSGKRTIAPKGTLVFGARRSAHTFKNHGKSAAKMLIVVNPGANFESFFSKVGVPGADGKQPSDHELIARTMQYAPEYGITILGPNPL